MSVAEQIPPRQQFQRSSTARRNGRWAGFLHVLDVRMKELRREPEVVFWVFGFPILLALGLGIAFRNKPADVTSVVIVSSPGSQDALASFRGREAETRSTLTSSIRRRHCEAFAWANMRWLFSLTG